MYTKNHVTIPTKRPPKHIKEIYVYLRDVYTVNLQQHVTLNKFSKLSAFVNSFIQSHRKLTFQNFHLEKAG